MNAPAIHVLQSFPQSKENEGVEHEQEEGA